MAEKHEKHTTNNGFMNRKAGQKQCPRKNEGRERKRPRNIKRHENWSSSKEPSSIYQKSLDGREKETTREAESVDKERRQKDPTDL